MLLLLTKLLLSHIVGDFIFSPSENVKNKIAKSYKVKYQYFHVLIHLFIVTIILNVEIYLYLEGILIITSIHCIVEYIKLFLNLRNITQIVKMIIFVVEQVIHIAAMVIMALYYKGMEVELVKQINQPWIWLFIVVILLVTVVSSIIIKNVFLVLNLLETNNINKETNNAGKWIGMMERLFVLFFVIINEWEGVGFLLTAKSIFRFGDLNKTSERKLTEYVLIGTLLSFGLAIIIAKIFLWFKNIFLLI